MENSKIEWTDHTFNPWVGCTKVSPGCQNCYAETLMDKRFKKVNWGKGNERKLTSDANWKLPLKWDKKAEKEGVRKNVFCASLADVFDEEVPLEWKVKLFEIIKDTWELNWLLLTKRPEKALEFLEKYPVSGFSYSYFIKKFWIGVSVCTQKEADEKIPILLKIKESLGCKVFLSMEPLLEKVDLRLDENGKHPDYIWGIDWIIAGGESGRNARPMNPEWVRLIRDQCHEYKVPFFFKQWGEWSFSKSFYGDQFNISKYSYLPKYNENKMLFIKDSKGNQSVFMYKNEKDNPEVFDKIGKSKSGNLLDGKQYLEFPEGLR
ncbi:MAG: phage Gp37/Gp68 family protein [Leptospiraceae bacterium]|nr:phage Gp37/Gp68 family protein [Leptospiraceae bacterium]